MADDLRTGAKLIAPAGSTVNGHVTQVLTERRLLHAEVSTKRWLKAGGGIGMRFDEIVLASGKHIKINAVPVAVAEAAAEADKRQQNVVVDKDGTIEPTRKKDLKPKAARLMLGVGAFVAGPITSVVGGVAGAVHPSTVLPDSPDPQSRKHRRLKGMVTGFVAGLPGGFIVDDAILKGQRAQLKPGTRLRLQWNH